MMEQNTMRFVLAILGLIALAIVFYGLTHDWGSIRSSIVDVFKTISDHFYAF